MSPKVLESCVGHPFLVDLTYMQHTTSISGASIIVTNENLMLSVVVGMTEAMKGNTRGLMGVYNGDPSDDLTFPNGTVQDADAAKSDEAVFDFGNSCRFFKFNFVFIFALII